MPVFDRLHDAEIHLLIVVQADAVRDAVRARRAQPAAGGQIRRDQCLGLGEPVFNAGRSGELLIVVEVDEMVGNIGQLVRREVELRRGDVFADRPRLCKIAVERPIAIS